MPTIKCPACGHRSFHASARCSNCGAPMASQPTTSETSPILDEVAQAPALPTPRLSARNLPAQRNRTAESYLPEPIEPVPLIPFSKEPDEYNPYLKHISGQPTIITEEKYTPVQDDSWLEDALPWWFPRRAADIAGSVIEVQSQQEETHAFSSGSFLRILGDMIWPDPQQYQQKQAKEMVTITIIRVRTLKGEQKIARLRGHLIKANLSLGDNVSLWGWKRGGVLFVRRTYNHTAQAVVATRATASSWPFWIVAALLVGGLAFLLLTHRLALPFLPS